MNKKQVALLNPGLYRLHWKSHAGGGTSVAAVGTLADGGRWLAPTNWLLPDTDSPVSGWKLVERVELLHACEAL